MLKCPLQPAFSRYPFLSENLDMGAFHRTDGQAIQEDLDRMFELFPRLKERRSQVART